MSFRCWFGSLLLWKSLLEESALTVGFYGTMHCLHHSLWGIEL